MDALNVVEAVALDLAATSDVLLFVLVCFSAEALLDACLFD